MPLGVTLHCYSCHIYWDSKITRFYKKHYKMFNSQERKVDEIQGSKTGFLMEDCQMIWETMLKLNNHPKMVIMLHYFGKMWLILNKQTSKQTKHTAMLWRFYTMCKHPSSIRLVAMQTCLGQLILSKACDILAKYIGI